MDESIKISVIIPHYRGKAYLRDALESLRIQNFTDMEIVIVTDGSSDDVKGLIEEYTELNIRMFSTKAPVGTPAGVAVARNIGLSEAKGEYVFFLDNDDYISEGYFETLLAKAEEFPDAIIRSKKIKTYFKREGQLLKEEERRIKREQRRAARAAARAAREAAAREAAGLEPYPDTEEDAEGNTEENSEENTDVEEFTDAETMAAEADAGDSDDDEDDSPDGEDNEPDQEEMDAEAEEEAELLGEEMPEEAGVVIKARYKFAAATALGMIIPKRFIDISFDERYRHYSDLPFMIHVCRNAPILTCKGVKYYKRTHNDAIRMPSLLQEEAEGKGDEFIASLNDSWNEAKKGPNFEPVLRSKYALSIPNFNPILSYIENYTLRYVLRKMTKGKHPVALHKWSNDYIGVFTQFLREVPKIKIKRYSYWKKKILKKIISGNIKGARRTANFYSMKRKKRGLLGTPMQWKWNIYKRIFRKLSVRKDIIFFESFLGRSYGDSCRYIYEYMLKLREQGKLGSGDIIPENAKFVWMIDNKAAKIPGKHKQVKHFSLKYFYYVARCSVWITNMRQPSWYVKREGVTLLECWHGTPLKRLVFDMEDVYSASPRYKMTVYNQSRMWDYLLSDNRFSTECFKSCFLFPEEKILELGYPRNDLLYGEDRDERARKIKERLGIPLDKKVVLYAPTWRDDDYYGPARYKFSLPLDLEMMKQLRDEYYFILRTHYFIANHLHIPEEDADFVTDQSKYNDIGELYLISDILITDYSSVFFDFANLRRPILFFVYDFEKYAGVLRGFYFDMTTGCPGPLLKTNEEVLDALENIDAVEAEYADKYKEFCDKFCYLDDGHASERIVKRVFGI